MASRAWFIITTQIASLDKKENKLFKIMVLKNDMQPRRASVVVPARP
ncbi:hypothetical protein Ngar_c31250 [Candidatus Nitrososphaera gargensis Ga9.2]|uniref:Uncharacterized protein n=1 Tax=Nitrososphaera gargensis (strain Ga9.2) TaxID=1237085 RepID=K0IF95_NITGG|nr:hypothetical protein Ngar_c31250 [Candidatus Nitrososphaera gargensis Ga9.2]